MSVIALLSGVLLLALATARYRLPYENGRYFDPETQVVYHVEAAEVYLISGVILTFAGLVIAMRAFRNAR